MLHLCELNSEVELVFEPPQNLYHAFLSIHTWFIHVFVIYFSYVDDCKLHMQCIAPYCSFSQILPRCLLGCSQNAVNPRCVFWRDNGAGWSTDGCEVKEDVKDSYTTCACNHLTNFALLMVSHTGSSIFTLVLLVFFGG